ncbi:MAG: xanthine phosphoribosyltransferase, partial [Clostridia bacterium]|nr:xanthine phosphoribosyltransferase [Clostridia bacterium]
VYPGGVLKVDSFLNHQIDADLLSEAGKELYRLFGDEKITKIVTVEASGIAIACLAAVHFGVPAVFAKKNKTVNLSDNLYTAEVESFTHKKTYPIVIDKAYITASDRILIVDDFLAKGHALMGLLEIAKQAGASVAGAGIMIEKCFQGGGDALRAQGLRIESLAMIESMSDDGTIVFRD